LDIRQLLHASPLQREARIAQLLAAGGDGGAPLAARALDGARGRLRARGESSTLEGPALEDAAHELEARLEEGGSPEDALAWTNAQKRRLAAESVGRRRAERALEARVAELPVVSAQELRDLEREAALLEGRESDRRRALGRREEAARALDEARRALEAAQAERARFEAKAGDWTRELARIERALDALEIPPYADPPEAEALLRRADRVEREAGEIEEPEFAAPSPGSAAARRAAWIEVGRIGEELAAIARTEPSAAAYRTLRHALRLSQLSAAALRREEGELEAAQSDEERARSLRARRARLLEEAARGRAEAGERIRSAREAYAAAHGEAGERRRGWIARREELRLLEAEDRATASALDRARREAAFRKRALDELGTEIPAPGDPPRLLALQAEIERRAGARAARLELERAMGERERIEAGRSAFAALEWALQRLREERLGEAGGPLVRRMTQLLRAGGRREIPYLVAGGGACRIGWRTPAGKEVGIQTLSGGEWTLFAAALTASMLLLREAPLRLLLVEAGEADATTLRSLLAVLRAAADGLTAAVVLTHLDVRASGWTVVKHFPPLRAESA
jgi:hypothetical protein